MAQQIPKSAAASIYPHLSHDAGQPPPRQPPASVAAAMYPHLVPQPKPKPPEPRPTRSKEWIRDWSQVDVNYARAVGLISKEGKR
jgi:hypothetical protein